MAGLRDRLQEMIKDENPEDVSVSPPKPTQYDKLILDETTIDKLTKPDKEYLEKFTAIETLSMTSCRLNSLENFPNCPKLTRVSPRCPNCKRSC